MKTPMRLLLLLTLIAATLTLAGCSYQPARIHSKPLIEIEGASGHRDYRGGDRHYRQYRHHDRYQKRHHRRAEREYQRGYRQHRGYRDRGYRESRGYPDYRGQRENRGHGRFCPPGLRKQGRC
ncbi:hypothetical protein [Halomonas korlensis]|uniref:Lipoprotein n=1 Tax=Halomonas korlensis TaxID=463301 RepID=A0A1I7IJJ0_9GAMM|nr:hypothetical protein [Halomonas korlensis]SFU73093.1 hypothetical protein SAMN04487955_10778 [Halomonas korlensis]